MKSSTVTLLALAALATAARADSLYYIADETQESKPLKWVAGMDFEWDDNVTPEVPAGVPGHADKAMSVSPYVGATFVSNSPQTTWDFYARLGVIYYFDAPKALSAKNEYEQGRIGVNLTHRFSERLRFSSRNFISYELEPDYSYGYANSRGTSPYLYWQTDNSIGFRWSERFATYTGLTLTGYRPDTAVASGDRLTWTGYNQFRYQASPQTVLTLDYRYGVTDGSGVAAGSTDQYILAGLEHRFSPTTIGVLRAGVQLRQMDRAFGGLGGNDSSNSPYVEAALQSRMNEQFSVHAFARYGIENYNNIFMPIEYTDNKVMRIGVSGEYAISPTLSLFTGIDYIGNSYDGGRNVFTSVPAATSPSDNIWNAYLGMSYKITDTISLSGSYNYTKSSSDIAIHEYSRNRVTVGVRAEF